eukprot:1982536-Pyramimonas_sp.AAC.1
MGALKLSLQRLSWGMNGFAVLVNDCWEEIALTYVAPALLKELLFSACLRALEREAAVKAGLSCSRLCFDVVRAKPRSKRPSPLAR